MSESENGHADDGGRSTGVVGNQCELRTGEVPALREVEQTKASLTALVVVKGRGRLELID